MTAVTNPLTNSTIPGGTRPVPPAPSCNTPVFAASLSAIPGGPSLDTRF